MLSSSPNSFSPFSYYEAYCGSHYLSIYPSVNTSPYLGKSTGFKVFDKSNFTENDLKTYLKFLVSKNFGFKDCVGWLLPTSVSKQTSFNASEICSHLNNLDIISTDSESDKFATLATVMSPVYMESFTLRLTNNWSPQKAIDTIPLYVHDGVVVTTLGYKKKSHTVNITFSDGEIISPLYIGIFGYVNGAGEHVNAREEGVKINECISEHRATINDETTFAPYKDVEIANRGLIEETGLNVQENEHAKFNIFGISDSYGRDIRYFKHQHILESGNVTEFGYDRSSESILITSIVKAKAPDVLPEPSDVEEMDAGKARLIRLEDLVDEFRLGGKYEPAFPEHVNQLHTLVKKLHLMI